MNRKHILLALTLAGCLATTSMTIAASGRKINVNPVATTATPALTAVETVHTAHQLVRYADANKDVLALIVAARMLKESGSQSGDSSRAQDHAGDKSKTDKQRSDTRYSVDGILTRARTAAAGRSDLLALVDDIAGAGTRGAVAGPWRWSEVVNGGKTDTYRINFRGGQPAAIAVSGDGDSDLDLYVYDEFGNLICKDEGSTDDMICRWNPRWTGPFVIKIRNLGVANEYVAIHN